MEIEYFSAYALKIQLCVGLIAGSVGLNGMVRQVVVDPCLQCFEIALRLEFIHDTFHFRFMGRQIVQQRPCSLLFILRSAM